MRTWEAELRATLKDEAARRLSERQRRDESIRRAIAEGLPGSTICERYGVSIDVVKRLRREMRGAA